MFCCCILRAAYAISSMSGADLVLFEHRLRIMSDYVVVVDVIVVGIQCEFGQQ